MAKLKALIIDDSEINQMIIQKMLDSIHVDHDVAFSGQEAIDKFSAGSYDLVFMDIQMPDMDGYETTEQLRTLEQGQNVPIIAVTANATPEDENRARTAGMDEFLIKPVYAEQVRDIIDRLIEVSGDSQKSDKVDGTTAVFDRFYAKINDDLPFLIKMSDRFESSANELLAKIRTAETNSNGPDLQRHVHTLKGIVAAFEVQKPYELVVKLEEDVKAKSEEDVKAKSNDDLSDMIARVETEINQMKVDLQAFIALQKEERET
jgi:CheY-like chemotaxis protein